MVDDGRRTDGRRTTDGRTTEHGYTISSPCEPDGSGELKKKKKKKKKKHRLRQSKVTFGFEYSNEHVNNFKIMLNILLKFSRDRIIMFRYS